MARNLHGSARMTLQPQAEFQASKDKSGVLAKRYGLSIGEVAALRATGIIMSDRPGSVLIHHGKGLKAREMSLSATVRPALKQNFSA